MTGFLDSFMTYGAMLAMAVLLVSLAIALVRGMRTGAGAASADKRAETGKAATGSDHTTGPGEGG